MFFGSSCIYPKLAPQPVREESMLTGPLETLPTNGTQSPRSRASSCVEAYRPQYVADFISVMPTNLFGSGDNYDPMQPRRRGADPSFPRNEGVGRAGCELWGTGAPLREFLYVDDIADASSS